MPDQPNATQTWSRRKRRAVKLAMTLASLAFALLLCEVALRLVDYSFPTFYTTDDERGFRLRPGARGTYRKEGESFVEINSAGLRDREHPKEKPPGTLRVAVVGDSYAEALQVPAGQAFWAVAERTLNEQCPALAGRRVEMINFGVSGYGTAQELITVRRDVFDYSPDIVLLAFTTNNDVTDNSRAFKRTDEIPYFVLRDGRLALDDSFRRTRSFRLRNSLPSRAGAWLRDNSRVLQAVNHAHYALKNYLAVRRSRAAAEQAQRQRQAQQQQQSPQPAQASAATPTTQPDARAIATPITDAGDVGIDNLVYREPTDATWQEAWQVTEALVVEMRDEAVRRGARFVAVTLSNGPQVLPDPAARAAFARRFGATDLFYPDLRIRALGDRRGFTVFNLAPELQAYAEQRRLYLHGFGSDIGNGHWNADGHRAAGELLAQKLCAELSE
jgi:hypothetical protein